VAQGITILMALSLLAAAGCDGKAKETGMNEQPQHRADQGGRVLGLPEGWELMPAKVAELSASQTPGEVIIRASGELPASNYEAKLFPSPLRIWPPQYLLARHKTGDVGAAVMKPFEISATFATRELVKQVVVSDAGGARTVPVDQARD
jgi:hypothetical protein